MDVQGLVVPMVVQEGRWQVRMYTGTEKLPGREEGSGHRRVSRELCLSRQGQACVLLGLSVDQSHISQSADKPPPSDQSHVSFTAQQTSYLSL